MPKLVGLLKSSPTFSTKSLTEIPLLIILTVLSLNSNLGSNIGELFLNEILDIVPNSVSI